eukprot:2540178-Rhodomonas_salina.1
MAGSVRPRCSGCHIWSMQFRCTDQQGWWGQIKRMSAPGSLNHPYFAIERNKAEVAPPLLCYAFATRFPVLTLRAARYMLRRVRYCRRLCCPLVLLSGTEVSCAATRPRTERRRGSEQSGTPRGRRYQPPTVLRARPYRPTRSLGDARY